MLKAYVFSVEQRYFDQRSFKELLYQYNYKKQHIFEKGWHYAIATIAILHFTDILDSIFQLIAVPIAVNKNWFKFQIFNIVIL
jgi:hypothetical protein